MFVPAYTCAYLSKISGRIKLRRDHSSLKVFCSGVPLRSNRLAAAQNEKYEVRFGGVVWHIARSEWLRTQDKGKHL